MTSSVWIGGTAPGPGLANARELAARGCRAFAGIREHGILRGESGE